MKKIIRVTESDLTGIVKRAINEIYSEKDMGRGEETIKIGGRKYKKILSSLSEIANMQDKIRDGISIMEDIGYIKLPEDDKIYILLYSH